MRVPVSWMREFVDVPAGTTHEQLHAALVRVGFEEEAVFGLDVTGPLVVGQVLSFEAEPQSNGKTINWCQIDVGEAEPRGIVCGAHNFAVADKVVVALPGAVLPGPFAISARKTYGHLSDGMMASARELGLGEDHDGILVLASVGLDPAVGSDAVALLGLDDFAIDVNVTPDRGYALSIRGIAREYGHSTGAAFRDPAQAVTPVDGSGFSVVLADDAPIRGRSGCSVFVTRMVENVDTSRPTPPWMLTRLALAGVRSISLPVDISNYVMIELGQPIHTYDRAKLSGGITVRRSRAGEMLLTLDGKQRVLDADDLVIADESGAIGLAGVMGGASTEIDQSSTSVLIEAANFDGVTIARTARRHRLSSEASRRFERGVDPEVARAAAARVVELLVELGGGRASDVGSTHLLSATSEPILLPENFVARLTGIELTLDQITESLEEIGCSLESAAGELRVMAPSWRPDMIDSASLAEEVARIVGYDSIPSILPVAPPGRGLTEEQHLRRVVPAALAAAGLTEVLGYPFVPQRALQQFSAPDLSALRVTNAADSEAAWLRVSLIPGLLAIAHRNLSRGLGDLALFELGTVFRPESSRSYGLAHMPASAEHPSDLALAELFESIPPQPRHLAVLFLGDAVGRQPGQVAVPRGLGDALDAVRLVSSVVSSPVSIERGQHPSLHPGRTASLSSAGRVIGYAGELLPALAAEYDLPRRVAVMELDLDALVAARTPRLGAVTISTYPAATQDLSIVVAVETPAGAVHEIITEGAGDLLEHASIVDDYRDAGIEVGTKSLTFALRFRAPDRTLTAEEATSAKNGAVRLLAERLDARLRE